MINVFKTTQMIVDGGVIFLNDNIKMMEKSLQYKFSPFFLSPLLAPTMFVKLINKIRNMCGIRFLIFYTYINWLSVSRNLSICGVN